MTLLSAEGRPGLLHESSTGRPISLTETSMSVDHHGNRPDPKEAENMKRLLDQLEGRAKRAYPNGRLNANDDGALAFAIAADKERGLVIIDFGKPTEWIGLAPNDVSVLVEKLVEKAREVAKEPFSISL